MSSREYLVAYPQFMDELWPQIKALKGYRSRPRTFNAWVHYYTGPGRRPVANDDVRMAVLSVVRSVLADRPEITPIDSWERIEAD